MINESKTRTLITIEKELKKHAEELAAKEERSFNSFVIIAIKERIQRIESTGSE